MKKILKETIRNSSTGVQAIDNVLPYVDDDKLAEIMKEQKQVMCDFYNRAKEGLPAEEVAEAEGNVISKTMMKAGASISAMINREPSHIAEMLIEGYQMGVTSMQKCVNETEASKDEVPDISKELVRTYDKFIKSLRRFL